MCNRPGCLYPQLADGQPYPSEDEFRSGHFGKGSSAMPSDVTPLTARDIRRAVLHLQVLRMLASPHMTKLTRAKTILLWRRDRRFL